MKLSAILSFCLALALPTILAAQGAEIVEVDQYELKSAQMKRFLVAIDLHTTILEQMENEIRGSMGDVSMLGENFEERFIEALKNRFNVEEFVELVAMPAMGEMLELDELTALADFVGTDFGREMILAGMTGEEFDVEAMIEAGEISEEELQDLILFGFKLAKKKDVLSSGALRDNFEEYGGQYGEQIAIDVMTELLQDMGVEQDDH